MNKRGCMRFLAWFSLILLAFIFISAIVILLVVFFGINTELSGRMM